MLGDIAIAIVIFVGGFYSGKKFDNLSALVSAASAKFKQWVS
jgi:hypothetical protein